jgi:hypothetical protein
MQNSVIFINITYKKNIFNFLRHKTVYPYQKVNFLMVQMYEYITLFERVQHKKVLNPLKQT